MNTIMGNKASRLVLLGLFLLVFAGCTKTFQIRPVQTPQNVYAPAAGAEPQSFSLQDVRSGDAKPFSTGRLSVKFDGMDDEITYLGENLTRVFAAEDIKLAFKQSGGGDIALKVFNFRMRNHRASGFSPYYTFSTFAADAAAGETQRRITAYFKIGKVPVWAFREVERPCYQIPLESVVKEIAAKLNRHFIGRVTPTEKVNKLIAAIDANPASSDEGSEHYLNVLELGYTNNPAAIPTLLKLAGHEQQIMRAAALSALGMLGPKEQLPFLIKTYETSETLVKAMALKAIGDIGTPEALAFIHKVRESEDYEEEMIKDVVNLYL